MKKALAKAQAGTYKHFALTQAIAALSSGGGYGFGGFGNAYRRPMFACTCVALCVSGLHELCVAPSTSSMFECYRADAFGGNHAEDVGEQIARLKTAVAILRQAGAQVRLQVLVPRLD